jgi:hypothetical protein
MRDICKRCAYMDIKFSPHYYKCYVGDCPALWKKRKGNELKKSPRMLRPLNGTNTCEE